MSYYQKAIKIYANVVNAPVSTGVYRDTALNYNPSAEPSVYDAGTNGYTSSGGETTGPAYDVVDNKLSSVITLDSGAETEAFGFDFDLTTSQVINAVIIANHTYLNETHIQIQHGTGNTSGLINTSYSSGPQKISGEWQCSTADTLTVISVGVSNFASLTLTGGITVLTFTDGGLTNSYANFRLLNYPATTYEADITIGEICLCKTWTAPHAPEVDTFVEASLYSNTIIESLGGASYCFNFRGERRQWTLSFNNLTQTQYNNFLEVIRLTRGEAYPFWIDLGEHATYPYLRYVRMIGDFSASPIAGGTYWNISMTIQEVA